MNPETVEALRVYLRNWETAGLPKPCNEDAFIDGFIHVLCHLEDDSDVMFDGNGAYFGKQVRLQLESESRLPDQIINFEIAYDADVIVAYSANHGGFYQVPYLNMGRVHPRFLDVKRALSFCLHKVFCLE